MAASLSKVRRRPTIIRQHSNKNNRVVRIVSVMFCIPGRLLLRHAMYRPKPQHKIAAGNPHNFSVREEFGEFI
jgi:hypothetical protein